MRVCVTIFCFVILATFQWLKVKKFTLFNLNEKHLVVFVVNAKPCALFCVQISWMWIKCTLNSAVWYLCPSPFSVGVKLISEELLMSLVWKIWRHQQCSVLKNMNAHSLSRAQQCSLHWLKYWSKDLQSISAVLCVMTRVWVTPCPQHETLWIASEQFSNLSSTSWHSAVWHCCEEGLLFLHILAPEAPSGTTWESKQGRLISTTITSAEFQSQVLWKCEAVECENRVNSNIDDVQMCIWSITFYFGVK